MKGSFRRDVGIPSGSDSSRFTIFWDHKWQRSKQTLVKSFRDFHDTSALGLNE